MKNLKVNFAKIGKVQETVESKSSGFSVYTGIGVVKVLAINPDKNKMKEIFGRDFEDISYTSERDGVKVARVTFILQTVPEYCNDIETIIPISFFLEMSPMYSKDKTSVKCLNIYGEESYVPVEDVKAKRATPGREWFGEYRPCLSGEAELVKFLRSFLNIPSRFYVKDGEKIFINNQDDAILMLEETKSYFDGNFKELKEVFEVGENNMLKVLFGAKESESGLHQDFYKYYSMKFAARNIAPLTKSLTSDKEIGRYPYTSFGTEPYIFQKVEIKPSETPAPKTEAKADTQSANTDWL